LEDFGRSKIYIIDHNPRWKENQRQKKESFWIRELQTFSKLLLLLVPKVTTRSLYPECIANLKLPIDAFYIADWLSLSESS
jgi:hypothetical protein